MIAGIITSLTDWLFAGDWLKTFYNRYPDVWRFVGCTGEGTAIALSSPMPFVTSAMFAGLRPPWPAFVGHGGDTRCCPVGDDSRSSHAHQCALHEAPPRCHRIAFDGLVGEADHRGGSVGVAFALTGATPVDDDTVLWTRRNAHGSRMECVVRVVPNGVEVKILSEGSPIISRMFPTDDEAMAWAEVERHYWNIPE